MEDHNYFMQKCIDLAKKGIGNVSPNPLVGSILVYNGKIVGKGYHDKYGNQHAEVNAINSIKDKSILKNSILYVNLEPCSHYGKNPPCSDFIIKHNIPKVIIGCVDTFSKVNGNGIKRLINSGVDINIGILENKCRELNKRFFTFHEKKRPYIILKWAETYDGFIAPKKQIKPIRISSNRSKSLVHKWRAEEDSILIGRITAEMDNPILTVRNYHKGDNPIRIVIDKELKLPSNLNIFNSESKTLIFNNIKTDVNNSNIFIKVSFNNLINNILKELYKLNIQSLIVEGGTITLESFIKENLWDEARVFTSKKHLHDGVIAPIIDNSKLSVDKIERYRSNSDVLKIITNK